MRIVNLALVVLGLAVLAPGLRAQIDTEPAREEAEDILRRSRLLGGEELAEPSVAQRFPAPRGVRTPRPPRPPRVRLAPPTGGDAELARLDDDRRRLIEAVRGAREVGDRLAMMQAMRRLESLRLERRYRLREVGRTIAPPAAPTGVGAGDGNPILPLPTLPAPERR